MIPPSFNLADRARQAVLDAGFRLDFPPSASVPPSPEPSPGAAPAGDAAVRDDSGLLWSSIDNDESRDLDQVEYVEETGSGAEWRVLVGIADVDVLVPRGSALDGRAAANATSVYTGVATFPMLPAELSEDRSSLREDQPRLALVVAMRVDAQTGEVRGQEVYRTRLRNAARLTYDGVGDWLDGRRPEPPPAVVRQPALAAQLRLQHRVAGALRAWRQRQGALTFGSVEARPVVREGRVTALQVARPNAARDLIESFMVAANVAMAQFLRQRGVAAIRRAVRTPARWDRIRALAADLGQSLPEAADARALGEFLARRQAADPDGFADLSLSVVKLLGPGEYVVERPGTEHAGHFGLAANDYTHSTAPNRRFADLVTQRLLKAALGGGADAPPPYAWEELERIAAHCTEREDAARKVERLMRKVAAADLLASRLGETFDAVVTGASPKGTYVRLRDLPAEGRVVQGERGLDVGQRVRVQLRAVDPARGFIDFVRPGPTGTGESAR